MSLKTSGRSPGDISEGGVDISGRSTRVCPVEKAGSLDTKLRRWFQNPARILSPYVRQNMTVVDLGCGPGFFTIDLAFLAGPTGQVIAADLQEGMLDKVRAKISGTVLEETVILHKCEENRIGIDLPVDFVLAFYIIHEVPDKKSFFREIFSFLRPGGKILIVEPPFHVSEAGMKKTIRLAEEEGLRLLARPRLFLQKTALMGKEALTRKK